MPVDTYADISTPLPDVLHGAARLHVALGRADKTGVSTRGWTYNDLVAGVIGLSCIEDLALEQSRSLETPFDTLEGVCEIGPRAVAYLMDPQRMGD